jgi:hypothetical protein
VEAAILAVSILVKLIIVIHNGKYWFCKISIQLLKQINFSKDDLFYFSLSISKWENADVFMIDRDLRFSHGL